MNLAKYSESTLTKILNIIDDYSHNKDEELASLLCIGIKEVGYFVIQFNIFDSMGSCCDNKYVNYFYKINIITCELVELEHEKDTFIKAIMVFIRGRMQERNKFRLTIHKEEDVQLYINILSQIPDLKKYLIATFQLMINLTESNIDIIVNYSKKHPNTIGRLRGKKILRISQR